MKPTIQCHSLWVWWVGGLLSEKEKGRCCDLERSIKEERFPTIFLEDWKSSCLPFLFSALRQTSTLHIHVRGWSLLVAVWIFECFPSLCPPTPCLLCGKETYRQFSRGQDKETVSRRRRRKERGKKLAQWQEIRPHKELSFPSPSSSPSSSWIWQPTTHSSCVSYILPRRSFAAIYYLKSGCRDFNYLTEPTVD